jgi:hypothetical protein
VGYYGAGPGYYRRPVAGAAYYGATGY